MNVAWDVNGLLQVVFSVPGEVRHVVSSVGVVVLVHVILRLLEPVSSLFSELDVPFDQESGHGLQFFIVLMVVGLTIFQESGVSSFVCPAFDVKITGLSAGNDFGSGVPRRVVGIVGSSLPVEIGDRYVNSRGLRFKKVQFVQGLVRVNDVIQAVVGGRSEALKELASVEEYRTTPPQEAGR